MTLEELRTEARGWLDRNFDAWKLEENVADPGPFGRKLTLGQARSWQRRLADAGWGAPGWPLEHGGRGLGPVEQMVWQQELARAGANFTHQMVGFGMAGPTIIAHGTAEQRERFLPPMLRGDEIWCQLFSEPGAGSDLASVTTRAVRDGDHWVVSGQKIWSSAAHFADWGILLGRFDFDLPKHDGLVYLVIDMHARGVEVRPLKEMDGSAHFNEVFLDGVRVPDEHRIGEPGDGWKVARTTLMNERMSLGASTAGFSFPFDRLVELARSRGQDDAPLVRQDLAAVYIHERILQVLTERIMAKLTLGQVPAAEGSIMKIALADLAVEASNVGLRLLRGEGSVYEESGPQDAFLVSRSLHLGGGTDEVQKNVIGERILGLPREPDDDRGRPFRQTKFAGSVERED
ncbi:MAG TPA: acyl-CoA dehydrogenase family protein [Actinomycetota bacterium]